MRVNRGLLPVVSDALVYGYLGTCVAAGTFGALFARTDVALVSGFRPERLAERTAATVLSQHRFLRAIEAGFGLLALHQRRRIHTDVASNRLFMSVMGSGIAARGLGRAVDGRPRANAYAWAGLEAVGLAAFFAHTRSTLRR